MDVETFAIIEQQAASRKEKKNATGLFFVNIQSNSFISSIIVISRGVVMCMDGWCYRKRPINVNIESGEIGHGARRLFRVFLFLNFRKGKCPQDSLLVSSFPIATTHATVKQAKAKKASRRRTMVVICSLIGVRSSRSTCGAPFWSELQSHMSKIDTPQQSEHVCPRGRPRGHPVIKYSIIDRESIDTKFQNAKEYINCFIQN
jgi:hypothetical protein